MIKEHKPKNKRGVFVMSEKNLNDLKEEAKRAILSMTDEEFRIFLEIVKEEGLFPSIQKTE